MTNYIDDGLDEEFEEEANAQAPAAAPEAVVPATVGAGGAAAAASNSRNFRLALGVMGGVFVVMILALVVIALTRPRGDGVVAGIERTNEAILAANTQTLMAVTEVAAALQNTVVPIATFTPTPTQTQVIVLATDLPSKGGLLDAPESQTAVAQTVVAEVGPEAATLTASVGSGQDPTVLTVAAEAVAAAGGQAAATQTAVAQSAAAGGESALGGAATQTAVAAAPAGARTATVAVLVTQQAQTQVAQTQMAAGQTTNTPAAIGAAPVGGKATLLPETGIAEDAGLPALFSMALGLIFVIILVRRLRFSVSH